MRVSVRVRLLALSVFALPLLVASLNAAEEQQWGTIKGKVIWGGDKIPQRVPLKVPPGVLAGLPKQLLSEDCVVDPKTKGVRSVVIWLRDDSKDPLPKLPIHPELRKIKDESVTLEVGGLTIDPHVAALRDGQSLLVKNGGPWAVNLKVDGSERYGNPIINQLLRAKEEQDFGPFMAQPTTIPVGCSIHPWMTGYVRVFNHPYFVVTKEDGAFEIKNAPAGKYRLVIWQESVGWIVGERGKDKYGVPITIKANATTDLGQFKMMPPKE